jgi:hypothetical protein
MNHNFACYTKAFTAGNSKKTHFELIQTQHADVSETCLIQKRVSRSAHPSCGSRNFKGLLFVCPQQLAYIQVPEAIFITGVRLA